MYLALAALARTYLMRDGSGWFPVEPFTFSRLMIGLWVWVLMLQGLHVWVKWRTRTALAQTSAASEGFVRLLTRRTFILIGISELAVFAGFILFLVQGEYRPLFGAGVCAMILYAQSHPRSGLPPAVRR